jgi:dolichol-phosphate mannosyltransferase
MISVVLPVYNEEQSLYGFVEHLMTILDQSGETFEILLINDGSQDRSFEIIQKLSQRVEQCKYVNLSRNFGHQIAITAGIDFARGERIVLMDSDGQDPPSEILNLHSKMDEGFDVVYAKRKTRGEEGFLKKWTAGMFYRMLNRITTVPIPMDVGDFRIINRKVVNALQTMPEKQRFLRGQISWLGFRQTFIEYDRENRMAGETKYTYKKMMRLALDGITSFSNWPLRLATISGFVCAFIGFLLILYTLYSRYITQEYEPGWASLMITLVFIGGIQLIGIGIIGEYIGRINENVKNRPLYVVDETNTERAQN